MVSASTISIEFVLVNVKSCSGVWLGLCDRLGSPTSTIYCNCQSIYRSGTLSSHHKLVQQVLPPLYSVTICMAHTFNIVGSNQLQWKQQYMLPLGPYILSMGISYKYRHPLDFHSMCDVDDSLQALYRDSHQLYNVTTFVTGKKTSVL